MTILDVDVENKDVSELDGALFAKMAMGGAANLQANVDAVNNLNVFPVPDGDTGDNMYMTIDGGIAELSDVDSESGLCSVVEAFAHGMLMGARGNSGVILSQFFSGIAKGFKNCERADVKVVGEALQNGVSQAYKAVLTPTEGTILTVAREAVEKVVSKEGGYKDIRELFSDLKKEMNDSLQRTPELLPVLKEAGVIDSGGAGLFYIAEGFEKVLAGEEIATAQGAPKAQTKTVDTSAFNADSVMTYGYCTELLLQLQNSKTDVASFDCGVITDFLSTVGDSVVSFMDGTIVKIHVHTRYPESVLEFCHRYGEFVTLKIENMSLQHNETIKKEEKPKKKYGIVTVCTGDGVASTFKAFGVDEVISGGQTNNPSTSEFIEAFDRIGAEHVFVFPNNSNIIMAAKQAAQIYDKAQIHVIESKDIGAGYVGVINFDFEAEDVEALKAQIAEAMSGVTTGYVSPAIRDAKLCGVDIRNGEYIGYIGKEIVCCDAECSLAARNLAKKMFDGTGKYILTVFCKDSMESDECKALKASLENELDGVEVYFANGGQEIYPYILLAE